MNTESLLLLKSNTECKILDESVIESIKCFFKDSNIKYTKKNKKNINSLKNSNFNLKKNKIENKFIFILNKLSQNNLDKILIEFIQNINISIEDNYITVQEIFFNKVIVDNQFIEIYCLFLINIAKISYIKYNYKPTKIINIISQYLNNYENNNEKSRLSFLKFIKYLVNNNFFDNNIVKHISEILIQNKLIIDIKFWHENFKFNNVKIKNIKCENVRDKLMLETIFDNSNNKNKTIVDNNVKLNKNDEFKTQCNNIIEEYLYLKETTEIIYFIENECETIVKKNKFIDNILLKSYKLQILNLLNDLISKNILDKNIFSLSLKNNYKKIKNVDKILVIFKQNNITKNLDHLFNNLTI